MNNTIIKLTNEIFNKFINPFDLNSGNYIGLELEFPIVNLKMLKNNMEIMQELMQLLINEADFKPLEFDNNGNISSIINNLNDQISFEYSINTLEFSLAKSESLPKIENVCMNYISIIQEFLSDHNSILTGFGIHPFYQQIDKKPINNNRYKVIHHFLKKENDLFSEFVAYTSSSQVHINTNSSNLPTIINTFSKIEWIKAILFSNSVMYLNKDDLCDVTCARDFLWQNSNFSFNRNNVGVYDKKFESIEDLIQDILERFMFYTVRNDQYICFNPLPLKDYFYFSKISGVIVNNSGGRIREVEFKPMIDDLNYFRSYKNIELTSKGTIEFRSECQQPFSDLFSPAAFYIGLLENFNMLQNFLEKNSLINNKNIKNSYLRYLATRNLLFNSIPKNTISNFIREILIIAYDGVLKRNYGEEKYLYVLFERCETLESPSHNFLNLLTKGYSLVDLIKRYATF